MNLKREIRRNVERRQRNHSNAKDQDLDAGGYAFREEYSYIYRGGCANFYNNFAGGDIRKEPGVRRRNKE